MRVRDLAMRIVGHLPPKDYAGEVRELHAFVRDHIRYVRDVAGVETIQTPERTLDMGQGDCDDKSTLLASLLASIGHRTRFEAIGFAPGRYSHVYPSVFVGGRWVPLETTVLRVPGTNDKVPPGWAPARVVERFIAEN